MFKKTFSVILCIALVLMCVHISSGVVLAADRQGYVTGSDVGIRANATTNSKRLANVSYANVTITGTKQGIDNNYLWYAVTYKGVSGYIRGDYIKVIEQTVPDADFETQLKAFPESYKPYIKQLHSIYPNWVFRADKLTMSFEEAVYNEDVWPIKLVNLTSDGVSWRSMGKGSYNWTTGKWNDTENGWTGASTEVIKYHMDPRNFLNTSDVYMFLQQGYDSSQTEEGIKAIVKGTFLEKGYTDSADKTYGGSYIKVILEAAKRSGVSAYVLAATIIQEQGVNGTSGLISGTTSHGKYFNFFNIGATGETSSEIIANGLTHAKNKGWNTRSAAIIGGAESYAAGYIKNGQDTYFYKNFDLLSAPYYSHQYAQNISDSRSSASLVRKNYATNYSAPLIFRIPVYTSIPDTVAEKPAENNKKNNYYIKSLSVPNQNIGFSMFKYDYSFSVSGDTTLSITLPEGASIASPAKNTLQKGTNVITIKIKAETGYTKSYTLNVTTADPCLLIVPGGTATGDGGGAMVTGKPGDTNGDGKMTLIDLTNVQRHLLKTKMLTGSNLSSADTNGDGKITLIDLTRIQRHLLGTIKLF